ncbi:MAG: CotH kinase family protein [Crocinitomicaceae bacterium]|nr:CotH kinase family protein [Crocinitomicaceae bacterium]
MIQFWNKKVFIVAIISLGIIISSDCQTNIPVHVDLPIINIVVGLGLNSEKKVLATFTIDAGDGISGAMGYDGHCGIELHGNSTLLVDKKSYDIELRDEFGEEVSRKLLDFSSEEDFILLAQYFDRSHFRNALAFDLWEKLGHYSPKHRYVEVHVNGIYQGVYLLAEKIKVDQNRVNLNVSYGTHWHSSDPFLMKLDVGSYNVPSRTVDLEGNDIYYNLIYPKEVINQGVGNEVIRVTEQVERSIDNIVLNRQGIEHYSTNIDVASFADYFLITELSKNPDGYKDSYFYRNRLDVNDPESRKLHMGPVWDFDLAFGNVDYQNFRSAEGWAYIQSRESHHVRKFPAFWYKLICDPEFIGLCMERLQEIKTLFPKNDLLNRAGAVHYAMKDDFKKDTELWGEGSIHTPDLGPLKTSSLDRMVNVINFFWNRLEWIEANLPTIECNPVEPMKLELNYSVLIQPRIESKSFVINGPTDEEMGSPIGRYPSDYPQDYTYELMNPMGEVVQSGPVHGAFSISYENLEPGEYYIEIENEYYYNMPAVSYWIPTFYLLGKLIVPENEP